MPLYGRLESSADCTTYQLFILFWEWKENDWVIGGACDLFISYVNYTSFSIYLSTYVSVELISFSSALLFTKLHLFTNNAMPSASLASATKPTSFLFGSSRRQEGPCWPPLPSLKVPRNRLQLAVDPYPVSMTETTKKTPEESTSSSLCDINLHLDLMSFRCGSPTIGRASVPGPYNASLSCLEVGHAHSFQPLSQPNIHQYSPNLRSFFHF